MTMTGPYRDRRTARCVPDPEAFEQGCLFGEHTRVFAALFPAGLPPSVRKREYLGHQRPNDGRHDMYSRSEVSANVCAILWFGSSVSVGWYVTCAGTCRQVSLLHCPAGPGRYLIQVISDTDPKRARFGCAAMRRFVASRCLAMARFGSTMRSAVECVGMRRFASPGPAHPLPGGAVRSSSLARSSMSRSVPLCSAWSGRQSD